MAARSTTFIEPRAEYADPGLVMWQADSVEQSVRRGDLRGAESALELLRQSVARADRPWAEVVLARCIGLVAGEQDFERHFTLALSLCSTAGGAFEMARIRLGFGERLRRRGQRVDARHQLTAALSTFESLGAGPWAERARSELEATCPAAGDGDRPCLGELTARELDVARVMADGSTVREAATRLFLSPKTVESHLGRIYRKLDVRNRAQLANKLADRRLRTG